MKEMKTKMVLVKVNTLTKRISFQSGKENYSDLKALEEEFNTLVSKDGLLSVIVGSSFHNGNYVFQVFDADFNEYVDIDEDFVIPEKCVLCFKSVEVPVGFHRQMLHQHSELRSITCLETPPCSNSETILPTVNSAFSAEPNFGTFNTPFQNTTEPVSSSVTSEIQINDSPQYNVEYKTNSDKQKMLCNVAYDHSKNTCPEQFIDSYPILEFDSSSTPSSTTSASSQSAIIQNIELPVFSAAIQARIRNGNVLRYFHKLVRESAEHLVSIVPFPSKTIYDNYARALCNTFPELRDEYVGEDVHVSLRNHITKKVRNMRYSTQANRTSSKFSKVPQARILAHTCEQPLEINEWQSSFTDAEENEAHLVCEPLIDSVAGAASEKAVTPKCEDVSMDFVWEPLENNPQQDYSECRDKNSCMGNQEGNSCMEFPMINRRDGRQQMPLRNQISKSIPNFRYRYREPNKHSLDYQNFQQLQDQSVAKSDMLHCVNSESRATPCLAAFKTNISGDSQVTSDIMNNKQIQFPVSRKKTCTLLMSSFRYKGTKNICNGDPCMALPTFSAGVQNKMMTGQLGSCYNRFVREAAAFFAMRYPWPTRQQYASYAKMLCDNYPQVKDKVTDGKYYASISIV